MTSVVNMRKQKGQPPATYDRKVDRSTIFGNPYDHRKLGITRAESVEKFRVYFLDRVEKDQKFREQVMTLKDLTLGCWCVPEECHATVIANFLNNICISTPTPPVSVPTLENLWTRFF